MELYSTDYVLFWVDSGEFEFEKHNYPFVYATCSVEENLEDGMENNRDVLETWVPTTELPKDKQSLLIKMISEVEMEEVKELPCDISVCSECDKHTDDDSPYNNTKWDNYGDPYCQDCFNKIESEVE